MHRSVRELLPIAMRERRGSAGRPRVPEPMVMNEPESVTQFHASGATMPAMQAVYDLSAHSLDALVPDGGRVLDLGVGSGRGLGRFLKMRPDVRATGVDLAPKMLDEARHFADGEGIGARMSLVEGDLISLPDELAAQSWDAISSVWALHHLPSREALRLALGKIARLRERDGSAVWLLDFQRLRNPGSLPALQAVLEPDVPPALHADAMASEAAAFTHEELGAELSAAGLGDLDSGLAQPIPWLQAFWGQVRRPRPAQPRPAWPEPLDEQAEDDAAGLRRSFSRLPI